MLTGVSSPAPHPGLRPGARAPLALAALTASFAAGVFGLPERWAAGALVLSGLVWLATCASLRKVELPRALVWGGFVLLRGLAWSADAPTSPDAQRYAWEAEVWLAGFNPYVLAPDSAELAPLARELAELHASVEHRSIPAVYPPLAQACFVLAVLAARAVDSLGLAEIELARSVALRLLALLGDLAVALVLGRWLARRGVPRGAWLAWAWCPLVALEFAGAAHFDALGVALALAALSPMAERRPGWSAVLLAGAVAVKLLPVCFAAWLPRRASGRRPLVLFALAAALLLAPQAWSMRAAPGSSALATYAGWWETTSAVYTPLRALFETMWSGSLAGLEPQHLARRVCVALGAASLAAIVWRTRAPERGALSVSTALIVLSPTFHPWYAAWLVAWIPLDTSASTNERTSGLGAAAATLAALAPAQYVMLERWRAFGEWTAPVWLWPLMFAAPLGLLVRAGWLARAR